MSIVKEDYLYDECDESLKKLKISNFVFTINNPEFDRDLKELWEHDNVKYIIYGEETGESGTFHYQGYCQLKEAQRFSWIKKLIPRAWFAIAKTHKEAIDYCKKENKFKQKGTPKKPGRRTDLVELRECVSAGVTKREFFKEYSTSIQSCKFYEQYAAGLLEPRPIKPIEVIWIYGPSGAGKTRMVFEEQPQVFRISHEKWWDGYTGQDAVLWDDFRKEDMPFKKLLNITDIYPFRVEFKGGSIEVQFTKFYITSPNHPETYVPHGEEATQLLRRITRLEYKQPPPAPPEGGIENFFRPAPPGVITPDNGI